MDNVTTIQIKQRNPETGMDKPTGETISTYALVRSMSPENFTRLFDDYLNLGGKGFLEGKRIGLNLRATHRTLQRLAICFAFGLVVGLSEQEYTDARNQTAIETAKKLAQLIDEGDLPLGLYI
jgi:AraC-like DNA-binding protein